MEIILGSLQGFMRYRYQLFYALTTPTISLYHPLDLRLGEILGIKAVCLILFIKLLEFLVHSEGFPGTCILSHVKNVLGMNN
ncbi:MAG TPA: hypothetical protein VFB60_11625 [Ktedonobacteraceae bacterium]|nr:hypothetical protein [Ktedonobacteraceae bacterium]